MLQNEIKTKIKRNFLAGTQNQATRLKWIESTLKKIPDGNRILDAGAGELAQKKYCEHLIYVSQDFAQYAGVGDGKGLQKDKWDTSKLDIISDITNIPEPDESFDAIMCIEVFEHLPEPISAIKEFSRLIKPKGFLILTAPFCSLTHFAPFHFYSGFNRYFFEKHLKENNFQILEIQHNGNFFEYVAQEILRIPFCVKKYTDHNISWLDKIMIVNLSRILKKYSKMDKNSHELVHFGFHILAQKG